MKHTTLLTLTLLIFLTGCSTTYVCYDGTERDDPANCPTVPEADIAEREAKQAVNNMGQALATSRNARYNFINMYQEDGDYYANVLFSTNQEEYRPLIRIDGETASPECYEDCAFFNQTQ